VILAGYRIKRNTAFQKIRPFLLYEDVSIWFIWDLEDEELREDGLEEDE
jgi:CRISPR/Cas system CSM-associated protein Csm4 (group 5 of RAMP superfamily)